MDLGKLTRMKLIRVKPECLEFSQETFLAGEFYTSIIFTVREITQTRSIFSVQLIKLQSLVRNFVARILN